MRFCFNLYGLAARYDDPNVIVRAARAAEAAGFDLVCITDHVVIGERTDRYPYGQWPTSHDFPWWEPLTTLAVVAGATERIGLTQGILIAPLRPATFLAKQAATLDQLSRGRLSLGLGCGWQREEFAACGMDYQNRHAVFVEQIRVMKGLWGESPFSFNGRFHQFDHIHCRPGPWQRDAIPILLGVAPTTNNIDWICELGDGWLPISDDPAVYLPEIATFRQAFAEHNRDPATFQCRARLRCVRNANGRPDITATLRQAKPLFDAGLTEAELYIIEFLETQSLEELDKLIGDCASTLAATREQLK